MFLNMVPNSKKLINLVIVFSLMSLMQYFYWPLNLIRLITFISFFGY